MNFLDMGFGEIVLILLVAMLLYGPEKLPELARKLGKTMRTLKKMSSDVTTQIKQEIDLEEKKSSDPPVASNKQETETEQKESPEKPADE